MALCARTTAARPAARRVAAARRAAPRALRVVAFRDVHREERIVQMGDSLVENLLKGVRDGPDTVRPVLHTALDPNLDYRRTGLDGGAKGKGVDAVLSRLAEEHAKQNILNWRLIASAACSQDDTYFALVEVGGASGAGEAGKYYKIFEADVLHDDSTLRALGLVERTAPIAGRPAAPFPEERIGEYPPGLDPNNVIRSAKAWCQARSSGQGESPLITALEPGFTLWDAAGLLAHRGNASGASAVGAREVQGALAKTKESFNVKVKLLDCAVSGEKNVAFTRWRSTVQPKTGGPATVINGIEVDVFGKDGKLRDAWLFRDPTQHEIDELVM